MRTITESVRPVRPQEQVDQANPPWSNIPLATQTLVRLTVSHLNTHSIGVLPFDGEHPFFAYLQNKHPLAVPTQRSRRLRPQERGVMGRRLIETYFYAQGRKWNETDGFANPTEVTDALSMFDALMKEQSKPRRRTTGT